MERQTLVIDVEFKNRTKTRSIRLRELNENDSGEINQIVRDYSEEATLDLYFDYCNNQQSLKNTFEETIRKNKIEYIFDTFKKIDLLYGNKNLAKIQKNDKNPARNELKNIISDPDIFPDKVLFSPYGSIQVKPPFESFVDSVNAYISKSIKERENKIRDCFHLGIVVQGKGLVGCLTFNFIEDPDDPPIEGYRTMGGIGVFTPSGKDRIDWLFAICPIKYFINTVMGYQHKSDGLFIRMTTHPCNMAMLRSIKRCSPPFISLPSRITEYGYRFIYVIKYSDFMNRIASPKGKYKITIMKDDKIIANQVIDESCQQVIW